MDTYRAIWEDNHSKFDSGKLAEERFLDAYEEAVRAARLPVVDLACGTGSNSRYLVEKGKRVLACDYSATALKLLRGYVPEADVMCFDMTKPFPLSGACTDLVVCDMGLHFFDEAVTFSILGELKRVLAEGGHLVLRVNAMESLCREEIVEERGKHFYHFREGLDMRFFDRKDIAYFFSDWKLLDCKRDEMRRYREPRKIWRLLLER